MRVRRWEPHPVRTATVALPAVAAATYAVVEKVRIRRAPRLPESARGLDAVVEPDHGAPAGPGPHGRRQRDARSGAPISLVTIGDSVASGVGATAAERSWAWALAQLVAVRLGRPVRVRSLGRTGARAEDVRAHQVPRLDQLGHVDVIVASVGGNDATHLTSPARFTEQMRALCEESRAATGAPVVLTGTPEFRSARAIGLPLRTLAWLCGQGLHERQRALAAELAGVEFVDVRSEVGADFRRDPGLVAGDGYHPSDRGAARLAEAVVPAVEAALADRRGPAGGRSPQGRAGSEGLSRRAPASR